MRQFSGPTRCGRSTGLQRASFDPGEVAAACGWSERDAAWAVALLLAVGVTLAWSPAGSIQALLGMAYGLILLSKVALVALLLVEAL